MQSQDKRLLPEITKHIIKSNSFSINNNSYEPRFKLKPLFSVRNPEEMKKLKCRKYSKLETQNNEGIEKSLIFSKFSKRIKTLQNGRSQFARSLLTISDDYPSYKELGALQLKWKHYSIEMKKLKPFRLPKNFRRLKNFKENVKYTKEKIENIKFQLDL